MSRRIETLDISLLRNNKNEFVIRCHRIIAINVKHFITKGMFLKSDFRDICQSVTLELIKRLPVIEKNYNGATLLTTYLNVVIENICLRIYEVETYNYIPKAQNEQWTLRDDKDEQWTVQYEGEEKVVSRSDHPDASLLISNEMERLKTALSLFHSQRIKIIVCLKVYFSISINSTELEQCFPTMDNDDRTIMMDIIKNPEYRTKTEFTFSLLTRLFNKYEKVSATEESVRRRTLVYIQKLITLMNGRPPVRTHTKETLKVLLEHYSQLYPGND